jgi:hypothetical protein
MVEKQQILEGLSWLEAIGGVKKSNTLISLKK